jgi:type II secretory pathway component PulC
MANKHEGLCSNVSDIPEKEDPASKNSSERKKGQAVGRNVDPKQKKMAALVGVLSVVFVTMSYRVLSQSTSIPATSLAASTKLINKVTEPPQQLVAWRRPPVWKNITRDLMKAGKSGRIRSKSELQGSESGDSPAPVAMANLAIVSPAISGIVYSKDRPSAIINGKLIHEGDTIAGAKIIKINRKHVVFEINGKEVTSWVAKDE